MAPPIDLFDEQHTEPEQHSDSPSSLNSSTNLTNKENNNINTNLSSTVKINNNNNTNTNENLDDLDEESESSFSSSSMSSPMSLSDSNQSKEANFKILTKLDENLTDSPTPTPTPNESKQSTQEKFNDFKLPPPAPNSLSLKTNLNSSNSKLRSQLPQFTSQPPANIYNTSAANTPSLSPYPLIYQPSPHLASPMHAPPHHHHNNHLHPTFINYMPTKSPTSCQASPSDAINKLAASSPSSNPSTVFVHVDAGHIFQVQLGDKVRDILGPATVKIVNNDSSQPVPLQLTAPAPGQFVQQIVDENGMLIHLIISSQQPNQILSQPNLSVQTNNADLNSIQQSKQLNNSKNVNHNQNYTKNHSSTSSMVIITLFLLM